MNTVAERLCGRSLRQKRSSQFLTVRSMASGPIAARIAARNAARLQAVRDVTFEQCADELMASHETAWRNLKHRSQWRATLATYAYPIFGNLPVSEIDTPLLMKVLLPIWRRRRRRRAGSGSGLGASCASRR
jgi:predicted DNA-binding protein (UPF0251 family)